MKHLGRFLRIRVVTAEPEVLLSNLTRKDIDLWDVCFRDLLTIELNIRRRQLVLAETMFNQSGCSYRILKKDGLGWRIDTLRKRVVFLIGLILFLIIVRCLQERVYFIETIGNESIPRNQIISAAENYGICFGAKASEIRSEELKNHLLSSIPQLQWVGVDIQGTRTVIQVKERSTQETTPQKIGSVSSIIAAKDGVITQMTVVSGTPLFQVGESVKKNDILVSGYTDCGLKIVAEQAKAEIYAHTLQEYEFIMPIYKRIRGEITSDKICYKLRLGKKVINLCNHSGISDATCVKMYLEKYWTLPGGFRLPVSVIRIEHICYDTINQTAELPAENLQKYARSYIYRQMIAGEILREDIRLYQDEDVLMLKGVYSCKEMIGQVKHEETLK